MTSKTLSDGPWEDRYPLHHGAREGILSEVRKYIEEKNFIPDEADGEFLKTPLMFSVLNRKFNIVEYLLNRSDVHVAKTTSELWSPLMMACREGDFDIVQLILEGNQASHVEINGGNHLGHAALHITIQFCPLPTRLPIIKLLLFHGADPNQRDIFGKSAIRIATESSQQAIASYLLAKTSIPVPSTIPRSRLVKGLTTEATPMEVYGSDLVPNKWVFAGNRQSGDTRPPIASRRKY